jgi:predicted lipid-binding transport protein (Tim44 family)
MIGNNASSSATGATQITTVGGHAGRYNTGNANTAVGYFALSGPSSGTCNGTDNTAIGKEAGKAITTGDNNTIIGANAGDALTTGENCTIIGHDAAASAVGAADEITLGDANVDTIRAAVTSISALSDKRDKKDIKDSIYGLDFVDSLKPVTFEWNRRDGAKKDVKDIGFVAQDLQEVDDEYTRLVYESNPEKLEATYGRLIPIMAKAIQELSAEVKELKKQING